MACILAASGPVLQNGALQAATWTGSTTPMHDVRLAFLWHQHQPYYPDDIAGENPMPWVRLHATRDYWGMAQLLLEVPEFKATINLVPSLLVQLRQYTEEAHEDSHLRVSRLPADGLSADDVGFLLDNFFMVHPDHNIRPYPRYNELYEKRGLAVDPAARAAKRFSKRDILDLQCWSNLVWMHPLAFELDPELAAFRAKGQHWAESEKQWLLAKQMEMLREVIPLHKKLAERGQIELSTTPFYHPILPLLWDKKLARQAMPGVVLPEHLDGMPESGVEQIRQAVAYHQKIFGYKPRGMWPSEGSVAQVIIPAIASAGIEWIATDEEILSRSTDGWVSRDAQGFLRNPEMLYRPWRVEEKGKQLQIVFRDHAMSDMIGFTYQRMGAEQAAADFVGRLEAIGQATTANQGHRPTLVSIILDGENCWEYYPNSGVDFLRQTYRRVVAHPKIATTRIADYLKEFPATDKIVQLFAGSWISHNFGIWLGHPECNRAWDLAYETRKHFTAAVAEGNKTKKQVEHARRELQIAEGSDWFWWFGDSHTSAQQDLFDRLFRKHLQNVYVVLEDPVPTELLHPIRQKTTQPRLFTQPTSFLNVVVDGRQTYFEWLNAGRYEPRGDRGTMSSSTPGRVAGMSFGFDAERLFLRLDARGGPVREQWADIDMLRVTFLQPAGFELLVAKPAAREPTVQLFQRNVPVSGSAMQAAADVILELAVPWRSLAVSPDDQVHWIVELIRDDEVIERVPPEGSIETAIPSPDFELVMWQV
jgi:alpha-amylase/alpha-mannosidase (GH57 family)